MLIRKAQPEDSESIIGMLMLATGEVVRRLIGEKNQAKAGDFLHRFVKSENNQYSFQNCYVAVEEGKIVGVILGYDGARLTEFRKPVLDHIQEHFNFLPTVEDETQAGEFYIDSIGVSPPHQGKGIGSKLIQHIIEQKVYEASGTLGLLVDKANPAAKRLYVKLGFETVGEKTLLGISLEHLQLKKV